MRRLGYRAVGETDSLRALKTFESNPNQFDAVVTDCAMPGISGIDLSRAFLRLRPELPIVVTSGRMSREDSGTLRALGVRELLPKPSSIEDLGAALRRLLG